MVKNNLLKIRLALGYKYSKDFAEFLEISPNQYGRYENNEVQPSAENLYKICSKTGKKIDEILYQEEP